MITIISTNKNKTELHTSDQTVLTDIKRTVSLESPLISDDFDTLHTGENLSIKVERVTAKSLDKKVSHIYVPIHQSWDKSAYPIQKSIHTTVSTKDVESENSNAEITFNFTKPTDLAVTKKIQIAVDSQTSEQNKIKAAIAKVGYWDTVHSIESKQGKLLYRPRNKSRSCTYTTSPCGHHQLTVRALKDIGCKSLQCRKDRLNYSKSLAMSKKLLAKNEGRLKKNGYINLEDYQRYLIHQQGASGIKVILAATKGEKLLSKTIKKNMANNSPYSYRQLQRMGSRLAARVFMNHWKHKWEKEKQLVAGVTLASNDTTNTDLNVANNQSTNQLSADSFSLPLFNENEIQLALNYKF